MRADSLAEMEADVETKAVSAGAGFLEDIARNVCELNYFTFSLRKCLL